MADVVEDREPSALLVVRAWRRPAGSGFTARLIRVSDLPYGTATTTVTGDPDECIAEVRAWVTEFVQRNDR